MTGLEAEVRRRARGMCEYCHMPEIASPLAHVLDHIIARKHRGPHTVGNRALCCGHCNLHKGPNIADVDPQTGKITRLFHPRSESWNRHFRWSGIRLIGLTAIGRTTIEVLVINSTAQLIARLGLTSTGELEA